MKTYRVHTGYTPQSFRPRYRPEPKTRGEYEAMIRRAYGSLRGVLIREVSHMIRQPLSGQSLSDARDWLKDCAWQDMDESDVDELSAEQITRGVDRHYDGGLVQFLQDAGVTL